MTTEATTTTTTTTTSTTTMKETPAAGQTSQDGNLVLSNDVSVEQGLRTSGFGAEAADDSATPPPVVSLRDADCAAQLWEAATSVGFFTVVDHDLEDDMIQDIFEVARDFFRLPLHEKEEVSPYAAPLNSGFEYRKQVRPSTGLPDVKESIQITSRENAMEGRWPSDYFEGKTRNFMTKAHALACRLLALLEPYMEDTIPPGTLVKSHSLWTQDSQCTLRMLHYPPPPPNLPPGSFRAGAHTDWDCLTLLFQLPGNEGLECAANPRKETNPGTSTSNRWVPVDPVPGGIAVNIGDMLGHWSDGKLLSNLHRVRMPTGPKQHESRYSIAFFAQADKNVPLVCRQGTMTAGEYILGRVQSNFQKDFEQGRKA